MNLFSDEAARERLRAAGWAGSPVNGRSGATIWFWREPTTGAVYREAEALAKLDEREQAKQ